MANHKTPKGLLAGSKFNRTHQTVIEGAETVLRLAKASKYVTKIHIGLIKQAGAGTFRLKFTEISGGLRLQVRGKNAVQIFILYTKNPREVEIEFQTKFGTTNESDTQ